MPKTKIQQKFQDKVERANQWREINAPRLRYVHQHHLSNVLPKLSIERNIYKTEESPTRHTYYKKTSSNALKLSQISLAAQEIAPKNNLSRPTKKIELSALNNQQDKNSKPTHRRITSEEIKKKLNLINISKYQNPQLLELHGSQTERQPRNNSSNQKAIQLIADYDLPAKQNHVNSSVQVNILLETTLYKKQHKDDIATIRRSELEKEVLPPIDINEAKFRVKSVSPIDHQRPISNLKNYSLVFEPPQKDIVSNLVVKDSQKLKYKKSKKSLRTIRGNKSLISVDKSCRDLLKNERKSSVSLENNGEICTQNKERQQRFNTDNMDNPKLKLQKKNALKDLVGHHLKEEYSHFASEKIGFKKKPNAVKKLIDMQNEKFSIKNSENKEKLLFKLVNNNFTKSEIDNSSGIATIVKATDSSAENYMDMVSMSYGQSHKKRILDQSSISSKFDEENSDRIYPKFFVNKSKYPNSAIRKEMKNEDSFHSDHLSVSKSVGSPRLKKGNKKMDMGVLIVPTLNVKGIITDSYQKHVDKIQTERDEGCPKVAFTEPKIQHKEENQYIEGTSNKNIRHFNRAICSLIKKDVNKVQRFDNCQNLEKNCIDYFDPTLVDKFNEQFVPIDKKIVSYRKVIKKAWNNSFLKLLERSEGNDQITNRNFKQAWRSSLINLVNRSLIQKNDSLLQQPMFFVPSLINNNDNKTPDPKWTKRQSDVIAASTKTVIIGSNNNNENITKQEEDDKKPDYEEINQENAVFLLDCIEQQNILHSNDITFERTRYKEESQQTQQDQQGKRHNSIDLYKSNKWILPTQILNQNSVQVVMTPDMFQFEEKKSQPIQQLLARDSYTHRYSSSRDIFLNQKVIFKPKPKGKWKGGFKYGENLISKQPYFQEDNNQSQENVSNMQPKASKAQDHIDLDNEIKKLRNGLKFYTNKRPIEDHERLKLKEFIFEGNSKFKRPKQIKNYKGGEDLNQIPTDQLLAKLEKEYKLDKRARINKFIEHMEEKLNHGNVRKFSDLLSQNAEKTENFAKFNFEYHLYGVQGYQKPAQSKSVPHYQLGIKPTNNDFQYVESVEDLKTKYAKKQILLVRQRSQSIVDMSTVEKEKGLFRRLVPKIIAFLRKLETFGFTLNDLKDKPFPNGALSHPLSGEYFRAVRTGNLKKVSELYSTYPYFGFEYDKGGQTGLHWATKRHDPEMVELILKGKCEVNAKDKSGKTPLYNAISHNNPKIVKEILVEGANPFRDQVTDYNYMELTDSVFIRKMISKSRKVFMCLGMLKPKDRFKRMKILLNTAIDSII